MDEGIKKKKIDIKFHTAGATKYKKQHRRCGAKLTKQDCFEDTAKHVLACNNGDGPIMNQSDEAELQRLVYVLMRAVFVEDVDKYKKEHPGHQYVFKADPALVDEDFRVDMINWLLPVYRELYDRTSSGVVTLDLEADIPDSFKSFKTSRLHEQSAPRDLLEEMRDRFDDEYEACKDGRTQAEYVDKDEYVQAHEFLNDFRFTPAAKALFADTATKADANKQLQACFEALYPDKYKTKANGTNKTKNKCIVGFKRKREDGEADCVLSNCSTGLGQCIF